VLVANELRGVNGPSYVTDQLYHLAAGIGKDCVIESIRTPGEIDSLRKKGKFFLFAVDAVPELRYERIVNRSSETDQITFTTFLENEAREMTASDPNKQNLRACILQADFVMQNNGTREDLFVQIENIFRKIT
jgi:dephospho-CoA kinase